MAKRARSHSYSSNAPVEVAPEEPRPEPRHEAPPREEPRREPPREEPRREPPRRAPAPSAQQNNTLLLVAMSALILTSGLHWMEVRQLGRTMDERLDAIVSAIDRAGTKVEAAAKAPPAPAAAPRSGPDPNKVYTVKTDRAPAKGPANAPVTIAEFSDFQCPFCKKVEPTLDQVRKTYGDKVRIVWKNMPLDFHKFARLAHMAAMEAHAQGKFWEYHDKLFVDQSKLDRPALVQYGREIGMDVRKLEVALDGSTHKAAIDADIAEARTLGVSGTPGFFVNGKFLSGAKPYEEFAKVIDAELAAKKK